MTPILLSLNLPPWTQQKPARPKAAARPPHAAPQRPKLQRKARRKLVLQVNLFLFRLLVVELHEVVEASAVWRSSQRLSATWVRNIARWDLRILVAGTQGSRGPPTKSVQPTACHRVKSALVFACIMWRAGSCDYVASPQRRHSTSRSGKVRVRSFEFAAFCQFSLFGVFCLCVLIIYCFSILFACR